MKRIVQTGLKGTAGVLVIGVGMFTGIGQQLGTLISSSGSPDTQKKVSQNNNRIGSALSLLGVSRVHADAPGGGVTPPAGGGSCGCGCGCDCGCGC